MRESREQAMGAGEMENGKAEMAEGKQQLLSWRKLKKNREVSGMWII